MKNWGVAFVCLFLGGCLSADLTHRSAFKDVVEKTLTIQRPSLITPGTELKSVAFGGRIELFILTEVPENYEQRVAEGLRSNSVLVPIGTELRLERIERRNLIDAGVEILAFGVIRNPESGAMEPFVHELTRGLGSTLGRAPWEDSSVPERRKAIMNGIRDFRIGPAVE